MSIIPKTFVLLHTKIKKCKVLSVTATERHCHTIMRRNIMKIFDRLRLVKRRQWVLIALLVTVTLFRTVPSWGWFYTLHIYPIIGTLLSPISGVFPFAIGDLFIAGSIAWCILYPIYKKRWSALYRVAEYLLWVYAWFYLAWGLNYSQPNLYVRIGMSPVEVSKTKFKDFAYRYADSLNYYCKPQRVKGEISNNPTGIDDKFKKKTADEILQGYKLLETGKKPYIGINAPFNNHPHVKTMVFSRLSSMAGVTGSMGPFFCEFTLNGEVRPHDYPSTYAHEFAHFLGIANEGEANFYSYVVCTSSADRFVRFSGYYHIFFHVLANVYDILGEKEGEKYLKHIRPEIIQLARSDRQYWLSKRCKALDDAQDFIFDLYLRGNHVAEGRKSYSGVIGLIMAWEEYA